MVCEDTYVHCFGFAPKGYCEQCVNTFHSSLRKIKYILAYAGKVGNVSLFFIIIYEDVVLIDSVAKGLVSINIG